MEQPAWSGPRGAAPLCMLFNYDSVRMEILIWNSINIHSTYVVVVVAVVLVVGVVLVVSVVLVVGVVVVVSVVVVVGLQCFVCFHV